MKNYKTNIIIFICKYGYMWLHKSRSVSERQERGNIEYTYFGKNPFYNKQNEIDKDKLFKNKGIDTNKAFNYKFSGLDINIFKLPIIDSQDNNSIYIGLQDCQIENNILCVKKDNIIKNYLLLPYFKVDKPNLEEGKYLKGDTKMSYHLGLFEIQVQNKRLTNKILIDTISLKNELTFDEFFNNYDEFCFGEIYGNYLIACLFYDRVYNLKLPLTKTIYFFDFSDINNPKIGTIKFSGDDFNDIDDLQFFFNNGRWFFQIRLKNKRYIVRDNCNGKYENMEILKQKIYYNYHRTRTYYKKANPYFPHEKNDKLQVDRYDDILFYQVKDFEHLSFSKSTNRYIRFQFTPFNNLNLVYYNYYKDENNLYKYCLLAKNKDTYITTELNPNNIINKYRINYGYKHIYHRYLYYLDHDRQLLDKGVVSYIQVWKDNKTKQVYGCILNMMGKRGVFDNEIIKEK